MARRVFGVVVASFILFAWSMFSWKVLPFHGNSMVELPQEERFLESFSLHLKDSTVYRFPGIKSVDSESETSKLNWLAKVKDGPFGYIFLRARGTDPTAYGVYIRGYIIDLISVSLMMWVLALANIKEFRKRWLVVTVLGSVIGLYAHMQQWNFMFFPLGYSFANALDAFVGWMLAGWFLSMSDRRI